MYLNALHEGNSYFHIVLLMAGFSFSCSDLCTSSTAKNIDEQNMRTEHCALDGTRKTVSSSGFGLSQGCYFIVTVAVLSQHSNRPGPLPRGYPFDVHALYSGNLGFEAHPGPLKLTLERLFDNTWSFLTHCLPEKLRH